MQVLYANANSKKPRPIEISMVFSMHLYPHNSVVMADSEAEIGRAHV